MEDEMGEAFSMQWREMKCIKFWANSMNVKHLSEDLGVDTRIMLKFTKETEEGVVVPAVSWLKLLRYCFSQNFGGSCEL
jgi:hypothetical protein